MKIYIMMLMLISSINLFSMEQKPINKNTFVPIKLIKKYKKNHIRLKKPYILTLVNSYLNKYGFVPMSRLIKHPKIYKSYNLRYKTKLIDFALQCLQLLNSDIADKAKKSLPIILSKINNEFEAYIIIKAILTLSVAQLHREFECNINESNSLENLARFVESHELEAGKIPNDFEALVINFEKVSLTAVLFANDKNLFKKYVEYDFASDWLIVPYGLILKKGELVNNKYLIETIIPDLFETI